MLSYVKPWIAAAAIVTLHPVYRLVPWDVTMLCLLWRGCSVGVSALAIRSGLFHFKGVNQSSVRMRLVTSKQYCRRPLCRYCDCESLMGPAHFNHWLHTLMRRTFSGGIAWNWVRQCSLDFILAPGSLLTYLLTLQSEITLRIIIRRGRKHNLAKRIVQLSLT